MTKTKEGKIIVLSAPSGCGKSTIINSILDSGDYDLQFSVSATNRSPRPGEIEGESYYFLSTEQFRQAITDGEFVEWEQVYPGRFYGTLRKEIDRILSEGHNVLLDIDVKGAENVKRLYGDRALTIFVEPPSIEALRQRLLRRGTESPEIIEERVAKADFEIGFADRFDRRILNDDLELAIIDTRRAFDNFLNK